MQANFKLGSLYDRRTDTIVDVLKLWKDESLKDTKSIKEFVVNSQQYSINTNNSLSAKFSKFDIESGLGLSICSGMINVEGSAQYLNDDRESFNVAKVALIYSETTKYQELTHEAIQKVDFGEALENKTTGDMFTHFVAGILFGCTCNIVFKEEIKKGSTKKEKVELMSSILEQIVLSGKFEPIFSPTVVNNSDQADCTIYSDVKLIKSITTWGEAITMCRSLQSKLFSEFQKDTYCVTDGVPVKLFLLPKQFIQSISHSPSPSILSMREVSDKAVNLVINILGSLNNALNLASDLKKKQHENIFDAKMIFCKIDLFINTLKTYKKCLQDNIKNIVKNIRIKKYEEQILVDAVNFHNNSLFGDCALQRWISCATEEVCIFENYTKRFADNNINFLNRNFEESDLKTDVAVVLALTLYFTADKHLENMKKFIQKNSMQTLTHTYLTNYTVDEEFNKKTWFEKENVKNDFILKIEGLLNFAEANKSNEKLSFFFAETYKSFERPQIGLQVWIKGKKIETEEFDPPSSVRDLSVMMVSHNNVLLHWKIPTKGAANITSFIVTIQKVSTNFEEIPHKENDYMTIEINDLSTNDYMNCTINDLECGTAYIASVVCTCVNKLAKSEVEQIKVQTRFCSTPSTITSKLISHRKIQLSWLPPAEIISDGIIQHYLIEHKNDTSEESWKTTIVDPVDLTYTFKTLLYSKVYKFRIAACLVGNESSLFNEFSVNTESMPRPHPYKAFFKKDKLVVKWRSEPKEKFNYHFRYRIESKINQWMYLSPKNICEKEKSNDYRVKIMVEIISGVSFIVQIKSSCDFGESEWSEEISCCKDEVK